ncbi:hypothetical protein BJ166DRAFT_594381 [Pestalotiopsis sp. NC0098]|nr:hypothetical protein BJ166DRAFT_594381 [Pestalotiopsis sp. NC0098]
MERHATEAGGDPESHLVGYMKLADFMSSKPDAAIFRRFRLLNMIHLLRLQAELQDLEDSLNEAWREDKCADGHRPRFCADFSTMRQYVEEDSEQMETLEKIGKKLEEYYGALHNALPLERATTPSQQDLKFLRLWLERAKFGDGFLEGIEAGTWQQDDFEYMSLKSAPADTTQDWLAKLLSGKALEVYNRYIGRYSKDEEKILDGRIRYYAPEKIKRAGDGIVVALSAVLPTLAILVLYFVKDMIQRIGLVILFTAVFAIAMAVFTGAKKIEIFSATAAFAAVEVVYIGSTASG